MASFASLKTGIFNLAPLLMLLLALLALCVTSWSYSQSQMLFNDFSLLSMLLASTLILLLASIIGIYGHKKNDGLFLGLFLVFVALSCGNYLYITISAVKLNVHTFPGTCSKSENPLVERAHKAYQMSSSTLCYITCPCSLNFNDLNQNQYSLKEKILIKDFAVTRQNGAPNFQSCPKSQKFDQNFQEMFSLLGNLETTHSCAGWCGDSPQLYYKFSDINRGKPIETCFETMKNGVSKLSAIISITSISLLFFLLIVLIANILVCREPERKKMPLRKRLGNLEEMSSYQMIS